MTSIASSSNGSPPYGHVVFQEKNTLVTAPERPLAEGSLQVSSGNHTLSQWTDGDHSRAYRSLQKITRIFEEQGMTQYLVYNKETMDSGEKANWEIIPYKDTGWALSRFWQQLKVLWQIIFGAGEVSSEGRQQSVENYQQMWTQLPAVKQVHDAIQGNDAFCNSVVIDKQRVLEGKNVRVLYNYAPIGFGGERLHFLVVPKSHRPTFRELTEEEYLEANKLTQLLTDRLRETRQIQTVYRFHKTGKDAGQTVPHWHMHVVLSTSAAQDFFGKLTVLKNMIVYPTPMKGDELKHKVEALKNELQ